MTAQQIYMALQEVDGGARANVQAAKAGFLEWAMSLPCGANACTEAQRALPLFEASAPRASAAKLFIGYLRDASQPLPRPKRRGGASAKRRILH